MGDTTQRNAPPATAVDLGAGRTAVSLSLGSNNSCAILDNGSLKCWGLNNQGQLGMGDAIQRSSPASTNVDLGTGRTAFRLSISGHGCVILDNGSVKCWGVNSYGQLGIGDTTLQRSLPSNAVALGAGRTAKGLSLGQSHSCVLLNNGSIKCWGFGPSGQLGMGDTTTRNSPTSTAVDLGAGRTAVSLDLGSNHNCAVLDNGSVKCWGRNDLGQLGVGDTTNRSTPTAVDLGAGRTAVSLSLGGSSSCAILDNGSVKCWGWNPFGQLGMGDTAQRNSPPATAVDLGAGRTAVSLSLGGAHSCAILDNGSVKCWGYNSSGQLGMGDTIDRNLPPATTVDFGAGRTAVSLSLGGNHSCAILDNGSVKCWGLNTSGQIGLGDTINRNSPPATAVSLGTGRSAVSLSLGEAHSCVILDNGSVKCWGYNSSGQLGMGDTIDRNLPPATTVSLGPGRTAVRLSLGYNHSCAVLDDGSVKCWGNNSSGELGLGFSDGSADAPLLATMPFTQNLPNCDFTGMLSLYLSTPVELWEETNRTSGYKFSYWPSRAAGATVDLFWSTADVSCQANTLSGWTLFAADTPASFTPLAHDLKSVPTGGVWVCARLRHAAGEAFSKSPGALRVSAPDCGIGSADAYGVCTCSADPNNFMTGGGYNTPCSCSSGTWDGNKCHVYTGFSCGLGTNDGVFDNCSCPFDPNNFMTGGGYNTPCSCSSGTWDGGQCYLFDCGLGSNDGLNNCQCLIDPNGFMMGGGVTNACSCSSGNWDGTACN